MNFSNSTRKFFLCIRQIKLFQKKIYENEFSFEFFSKKNHYHSTKCRKNLWYHLLLSKRQLNFLKSKTFYQRTNCFSISNQIFHFLSNLHFLFSHRLLFRFYFHYSNQMIRTIRNSKKRKKKYIFSLVIDDNSLFVIN